MDKKIIIFNIDNIINIIERGLVKQKYLFSNSVT